MPSDLLGIPGDGGPENATYGMIPGEEHPGDSAWSEEGSQISEQITFEGGENYWTNLRRIIRQLLGVNSAHPGSISRIPPHRHPVFKSCIASRITSVKGIGRFDRDKATGLGLYERGVLTVVYEKKLYQVLGDGDIAGDETRRWAIKPADASVYLVALQGVRYTFPNNLPFAGTAGRRAAETHYQWTWVSVPINAIFDDDGRPTKACEVIGRVNSDVWLGVFAADTLLMEGVAIQYKIAPIEPRDMNMEAFESPILCDLTYSFKEVMPPRPGHNFYPDKNGAWGIPTDLSGNSIYESVDWGGFVFAPL